MIRPKAKIIFNEDLKVVDFQNLEFWYQGSQNANIIEACVPLETSEQISFVTFTFERSDGRSLEVAENTSNRTEEDCRIFVYDDFATEILALNGPLKIAVNFYRNILDNEGNIITRQKFASEACIATVNSSIQTARIVPNNLEELIFFLESKRLTLQSFLDNIKDLYDRVNANEQIIADAEQRVEEALESITGLLSRIEEYSQQLIQMKSDIDDMQGEVTELKTRLEGDVAAAIYKAEADIKALETYVRDVLEAKVERATTDVDNLISTSTTRLDDAIETLQDKVTASITTAENQVSDLINTTNTDVADLITTSTGNINATIDTANTNVQNLIETTNQNVTDTINQVNADVADLIIETNKSVDELIASSETQINGFVASADATLVQTQIRWQSSFDELYNRFQLLLEQIEEFDLIDFVNRILVLETHIPRLDTRIDDVTERTELISQSLEELIAQGVYDISHNFNQQTSMLLGVAPQSAVFVRGADTPANLFHLNSTTDNFNDLGVGTTIHLRAPLNTFKIRFRLDFDINVQSLQPSTIENTILSITSRRSNGVDRNIRLDFPRQVGVHNLTTGSLLEDPTEFIWGTFNVLSGSFVMGDQFILSNLKVTLEFVTDGLVFNSKTLTTTTTEDERNLGLGNNQYEVNFKFNDELNNLDVKIYDKINTLNAALTEDLGNLEYKINAVSDATNTNTENIAVSDVRLNNLESTRPANGDNANFNNLSANSLHVSSTLSATNLLARPFVSAWVAVPNVNQNIAYFQNIPQGVRAFYLVVERSIGANPIHFLLPLANDTEWTQFSSIIAEVRANDIGNNSFDRTIIQIDMLQYTFNPISRLGTFRYRTRHLGAHTQTNWTTRTTIGATADEGLRVRLIGL